MTASAFDNVCREVLNANRPEPAMWAYRDAHIAQLWIQDVAPVSPAGYALIDQQHDNNLKWRFHSERQVLCNTSRPTSIALNALIEVRSVTAFVTGVAGPA